MGNPLSQQSLDAFSDELQKLAQGGFLRSVGKFITTRFRNPKKLSLGALSKIEKRTGTESALERLREPIKGLRRGWAMSSPLPGLESKAKELGYGSASEAAAALKGDPQKYKELFKGLLGLPLGEHLLGPTPGAGRVRSLAEGLSRQGWTGAGRATKYLPVGTKSLITGFSGMAIPDIVNAPKPTQTGEGAALEKGLGELGSAAGMIMGTGTRFLPAMGLWYGGSQIGSRLGRIVDRLRAGAPLGTAVSAPSPEQAAEQLQTIQKYYG